MSSSIKTTKLPNGILVMSESLPHVETVSFGVYVRVGSRDELASENGIAHFLEHMAFKGTPKRSAIKIAQDVEDVGGFMNACTSREQTIFYIKLLKEHLHLGIDILGDIMSNSLFEDKEIERERGVILQEIGQTHDTPDDIIFDYYQQAAFPEQSLGRPILGTDERVRHFKRSDLIGFMQKHYTPENIVIAAAGACEHDSLVREIEKHFAIQKRKPSPSPESKPSYHGDDTRIPKELDQAHIILGFPALSYKSDNYVASLLLSTLLGGGMSSRLFQEIRERRGLVYSIFSGMTGFRDTGLFTIYAATGEQEAAQLLEPLIHELHKVQQHITKDELIRSKAQLKAGLLMSLESTDQRCDRMARHQQLFGRIIPVEETIARIENVTIEQTRELAHNIFTSRPNFTALGAIKYVPTIDSINEALNHD